MPRGPSRPYPVYPVKEAALIADTIRNANAGRPMNRILLAGAMNLSPTTTRFRDLVTASAKYKFTTGNYNSEIISLTPLGEQLTKPRNPDERLEALRQGMRNIPLFNQILEHFDNNRLPEPTFLKNTLEREPFNITPEWSGEASELFTANGREVGFVRIVSNAPYVITESGAPVEDVATDLNAFEHETDVQERSGVPATAARQHESTPSATTTPNGASLSQASPSVPPVPAQDETPSANRQFFIAHGWDKEALQQVQNILNRFRIPFVVAQDEPNAGRPISEKIRDLMKSCSAGIFIFSADEEFKTKDGETIWRPRENVIFELGAGSFIYGQRIVILKEQSVYFPSDFRDIGYIEYERENLQAKAMELFEELIAFRAIRVTP